MLDSALVFSILVALTTVSAASKQIIVGAGAPEMEKYAARELQRYLYEISGELVPINTDSASINMISFVVGQRTTNGKINDFVNAGQFTVGPTDPGAQGYVLKSFTYNSQLVLAIAGSDAPGSLYGVYGLLDDYYGIGFYMGGDVLPDTRSALSVSSVNEKKAPRQYIRGILPWTNFPQSATAYSMEDWKFILDQMTKMRMNLINIHTYNETGQLDGDIGPTPYKVRDNEIFHNWEYNGYRPRVWMPTARTGHCWSCPPWRVNEYLFGAGDLFNDYDFGADCALHNPTLGNLEVFRKGSSEFQRVLQYAHSRGVKVALGLDIDMIPLEFGTTADNPAIVDARTTQITSDYPDLDYLIMYRSETMGQAASQTWNNIFTRMYNNIKTNAPQIKIAVSGWGIAGSTASGWPADVICAPISPYVASFDSGASYGSREYWGGPWMERDADSSEWFYPYNMNLSDTISSYGNRASNMKGFFTLTWRLTDAIDPKLAYIAKAPWDYGNKYTTSFAVYNEYAVKNYGSASAGDLAAIINQNEPYATNYGECQETPQFTNNDRSADINKANSQLATIDNWINNTPGAGAKARIKLLRNRIDAVKAYCELDQGFNGLQWDQLPGAFERFTKGFRDRVTDISSLGSVQSVENRLVQERYLAKETGLRDAQAVASPSRVEAGGTITGAVITWKNEESNIQGFNIYRNGSKINGSLLSSGVTSYTDISNGQNTYRVSAVSLTNAESPQSVPSVVKAGNSDNDPPNVILISPPSSHPVGQPVEIEARVLDDRTIESRSATLYYRTLGTGSWTSINMVRRVRAIFTATIPGNVITTSGVEYYVAASDGTNTGYFPKTAPSITASVIGESIADSTAPGTPGNPALNGKKITWTPSTGDVFWYKIYRGTSSGFTANKATFLTYVYKDTTSFLDNCPDFSGRVLAGTYYYKISAIDKYGNESSPTSELAVSKTLKSPFNIISASDCDEQYYTQIAECSEGGDCIGWIPNRARLEFDDLDFGAGATSFQARVASGSNGGNIEIWVDGLYSGSKIGTCAVPNTGGWQNWVTVNCSIPNLSGIHRLTLKFVGSTTGCLLNISWFKFNNDNTLLSDDFSGNLSKWANTTNASINNGQLTVTNNESMQSVAGGSGWTDYSFQVDVKVTNAAAGLVFRKQDENNFYMWQLNSNGNLRPHKKVSGGWTVIKELPAGITANTTFNVKIEAVGSSIKTYLNGSLIDTTTDSTFVNGKVGFRQSGAESAVFDNVSVTGSQSAGNNKDVYKYNGSGWDKLSGSGYRISADKDGYAWLVNNSTGDLWKWNGSSYDLIRTGDTADVGCGADGTVAIITLTGDGNGGKVLKKNGANWDDTGGRAKRVDVESNGNIWAVNTGGDLYKYNGSWTKIRTADTQDVGCGPSGSVVITKIDSDINGGPILKYNGSGWDIVDYGSAQQVDVANDGTIWVVNKPGDVYAHPNGGSWTLKKSGGTIDVGCSPSLSNIQILSN